MRHISIRRFLSVAPYVIGNKKAEDEEEVIIEVELPWEKLFITCSFFRHIRTMIFGE